MLHRNTIVTTAVSVPIFAVGGALSRYTFRMTETRWQIAAFVTLAVAAEAIARRSGPGRASLLRFTINAAAAAIVITLVKFQLEPVALKQDSAAVRHDAKAVVRNVVDR